MKVLNNQKGMTRAARGLLIGAAALAAYLGFASSGAGLAGCGDGSACDALLAGKWSKAFGVPVAFLGMAAYIALAALAGRVARGLNDSAALGGLTLMIVIPAVAVWFGIVQVVIERAVCPWCCAAHALAVLGVLTLLCARVAARRKFAQPPRANSNYPLVPAASGLLVLTFIAAAGLDDPAERNPVATTTLDSSPKRVVPVKIAQQPEDEGPEAIDHLGDALELHGGAITLWPEELPSLGDPKAEHLGVLLGDFTCEHCRSAHAMLDQVASVFGKGFGVVLLPAARTEEARLIQRVALAVHRENPELYRSLAVSLGSGETEPTLDSVTEEAARLIGVERLGEAMREHRTWIDTQLLAASTTRAANAKESGRRTLPQLMIGDELVFGAHPSPGYYVDLVQRELGIRQVEVVENVVGTGSGEERPELQLKSRRISLGKVRAGETLNVALPFENIGEGELVFNWVKTQPGVQVADLPSGEIEPGGKGEIAFNVRTPEQGGAFTQTLVVHSNANLGGLAVNIRGEVAPAETRQANAADGEPE